MLTGHRYHFKRTTHDLCLDVKFLSANFWRSLNKFIQSSHLISSTLACFVIFVSLVKFLFPSKLAQGYYWVNPSFSFIHVLLPLVIDITIIALATKIAFLIKRRATEAQCYTYMFFSAWAALGLLTCLQIIPLDMTASETWFYCSMAGILGMLGVIIVTFKEHLNSSWCLMIAVLIIVMLGFRTAQRGLEWKNPYTLAMRDAAVTDGDTEADSTIASWYVIRGNYNQARVYALRSISVYPSFTGYNNLGVALANLGDYTGASEAYDVALKYNSYSLMYENLAELTLVSGNPIADKLLLHRAISLYPQDATVWMYVALFDDKYGDNIDSRTAMTRAINLGNNNKTLYDYIMTDQSFTLNVLDKSVFIP